MAQGQPPPDPQQVEQAKQAIILKHQKEIAEVVTVEKVFGLFKAERVRPFVLQIATDSTIQPDENAEKQARNEFGAAFAQATTALAPLVQTAPAESADFVGEMLKFMMAPYRAGRPMEQAIDDFTEQMKEKAKQPPPPNPEQIKMEAEAKRLEVETAGKAAELEDRKAERAAKEKQALIDEASKAAEHKRASDQAQMDVATKAMDDKRKAEDDFRAHTVANAEAQAKLAEIDRKTQADIANHAHLERMAAHQERLMLLQIRLAESRIDAAEDKAERDAKKVQEGNGEARV